MHASPKWITPSLWPAISYETPSESSSETPLNPTEQNDEEEKQYKMDSVLKKRRKKMNHHKYRKRLKKMRSLMKRIGK